MEVTLVVVTLVSIALAMTLGVIAWRLQQGERLRADARVAALERGLTDSLQSNPPSRPVAVSTSNGTGPYPEDAFAPDDTDYLAQFPSHELPSEPVSEDAPAAAIAHAGLFGRNEVVADDAGMSRRVVAIAGVAAVMISGVIAFWTISSLMVPPADPRTGTTAVAANGAATTAGPAALELVSLRHEQQDGSLTITGLVRNPHGGTAQERLTAVVFFFDGQGGFLSSTRAPLDFRTLAPGEESPFQLSAPAPANVARYRVSFRREEGAIVPHVDRRQQEASRS